MIEKILEMSSVDLEQQEEDNQNSLFFAIVIDLSPLKGQSAEMVGV